MGAFMDAGGVCKWIVSWLEDYVRQSKSAGFVIGISGGIDSAVTSALCARTELPCLLIEMPIYQAASQVIRAQDHMSWLCASHPGVRRERVDLTPTFDQLLAALPQADSEQRRMLALANTRARLRMTTLYYFAGQHGYLVAGTGNKVEDFGVGFFTKYGDGGVDLSPIADLTKTEVYALAAYLGISEAIRQAPPTDGLWGDNRTDEDQIGATYRELEWAMEFAEQLPRKGTALDQDERAVGGLNPRQREVLAIYVRMHNANRHKMDPIPVCVIPDDVREGRRKS